VKAIYSRFRGSCKDKNAYFSANFVIFLLVLVATEAMNEKKFSGLTMK